MNNILCSFILSDKENNFSLRARNGGHEFENAPIKACSKEEFSKIENNVV
jgi:hypothetical protein